MSQNKSQNNLFLTVVTENQNRNNDTETYYIAFLVSHVERDTSDHFGYEGKVTTTRRTLGIVTIC